jgi:CubicO group peptidase (beta-lactamase class C family)
MFAFHQMMLNGGTYGGRRILSSGSVEVMTHIHTGELMGQEGYKAKANAGLGWHVVGEPRETLRLTSIGAYGKGGLLGSYGWVDPKKELVGIFLIHRDPSDSPASQARHAFMAMAAAAIVD